MLAFQEGDGSREPAPNSSTQTSDSTVELPCFTGNPEAPCPSPATEPPPSRPAEEDEHAELRVSLIGEATVDSPDDLVIGCDDDAVDDHDAPLQALLPLLQRSEPLTWVFAGARIAGDVSMSAGRLVGEWFAEEWRAESGRATDLVIDATWPASTLSVLKTHLKTRIVRHRPDVAVLFLDRSDSSGGVEQLPQFERRMVAVLSVLSEIGALAVVVQPPLRQDDNDIDAEIYFEAISGIARERSLPHLVLPEDGTPSLRKGPDAQARNAALFFCREVMRSLTDS
ncbi:hypothetical protein Pan44_12140 [Caulifigura coniformis]|uniref:SGNH hydrolase-type esterase domain-containing protein n=1 Tax=Caulifigura coniformis TaxID=2527983 RepID=A0A517SAP5_9PLAN|nr:hypothetical protein [Caulifigura coniformis]QDT53198.1 hypothetical protein Pan44_12140 [Caulifigura coniformis]